jgi:2'-5' RNA ligase
MIRAFVALPLPAWLRERLAAVQDLLPLPRRADPGTMHLTLAFLGDTPEPVLEDVHHGLAALGAAPVPLVLAGLGLFGGGRPHTAWAGIRPAPPLDALQRRVARACATAGAPPEGRRFLPHVTLGRFPPPDPEATARLERAIAAGSGLEGEGWTADCFALFESRLGRSGAHHEELARYPLVAR